MIVRDICSIHNTYAKLQATKKSGYEPDSPIVNIKY